jgi:hypothetical protein
MLGMFVRFTTSGVLLLCALFPTPLQRTVSVQVEWLTRPASECGVCIDVLCYEGSMTGDCTASRLEGAHAFFPSSSGIGVPSSGTADVSTMLTTTSLGASLVRPAQKFALAAVHNGVSQVLYAPLQLHLERRKRAQVILLKHEVSTLRSRFNQRFEDLQGRKRQCLNAVAERVARIAEIQKNLECSAAPEGLQEDGREDVEALIRVQDHEVNVPKWLSPADRYAHVAAFPACRHRWHLRH